MVLADPLIQKNGRQGQAQNGVDLFGSPNANYSVFWGIQCKVEPPGRSSDSILANVKQEVDKAESFEPKLEHWIFSTTAPVDAVLQRDARNLSQARARDGLFTLSVLGWDEIVSLLCTHADVMAEFYPGHGVNIKEILQELQQLPNAQEVHELLNAVRRMADRDSLGDVGTPAWRTVVFDESRDLGPALMGRSLGPRDVTACPTLPEAIAAIEDLKRAYGTRLVGPPGSGKSICMYQAAHHFAINDWQVLQLASPRTSVIDLHAADLRHPTLFLIDDAHLTEAHALQEAEDTAGPNHLLLSTHNSVGHDTASRGAIVVDQKRAVRTIATTLRADLQRTLEAVSRVDDRVGRRPLDESIEHRIGEAERAAEFPWQFCFVLGGGWRRATDRVTAARGAEADICLAGVAIHQIASRDARPDLRELLELLIVSDLDARQVHSSLRWLIRERLVIGSHDLRCPHQRFAMVALTTVLEGRDAAGRDRIGKLLQHFVKGSDYPLAGHYFLLQTLRLADSRRWTYLLPEESLEPLVRRCWHAATPELRNFASLVLSELQSYVRGWPGAVFDGNEQTFSGWISDPRSPSGHGLALALHAVRARDDALARALVEESSAREVAKAVSHATPETAYGLGELLGALHPDPSAPWGHALLTALDRQRLVSLARHWACRLSSLGLREALPGNLGYGRGLGTQDGRWLLADGEKVAVY